MFYIKVAFMILQVFTGVFFIGCIGNPKINALGQFFCVLGIVELFLFVWMVASRMFF